MNDLLKYRQEIDALDQEITKLLNNRFKLSLQVKAYKEANKIEVLDSNREQEINNYLDNLPYDKDINSMIKDVYQQILISSKQLQSK